MYLSRNFYLKFEYALLNNILIKNRPTMVKFVLKTPPYGLSILFAIRYASYASLCEYVARYVMLY